jgi:hypothetical protein
MWRLVNEQRSKKRNIGKIRNRALHYDNIYFIGIFVSFPILHPSTSDFFHKFWRKMFGKNKKWGCAGKRKIVDYEVFIRYFVKNVWEFSNIRRNCTYRSDWALWKLIIFKRQAFFFYLDKTVSLIWRSFGKINKTTVSDSSSSAASELHTSDHSISESMKIVASKIAQLRQKEMVDHGRFISDISHSQHIFLML